MHWSQPCHTAKSSWWPRHTLESALYGKSSWWISHTYESALPYGKSKYITSSSCGLIRSKVTFEDHLANQQGCTYFIFSHQHPQFWNELCCTLFFIFSSCVNTALYILHFLAIRVNIINMTAHVSSFSRYPSWQRIKTRMLCAWGTE